MPILYHHLYDPTILSRAYALANDVHIEIYENDKLTIKANVKGSKVYNVIINMEDEKVTSVICNCPYPNNYCKHSAAVLLYLDESYLKKMQDKMTE